MPTPAILSPLPPPTVGRSGLLVAIDTARAAYAAGQPDASSGLTGRRFTLRQAFGCASPAKAGPSAAATSVAGVARWEWGRDHKTLEIGLTPADWATAPVLSGETTWEAVEGYWLTWPWLQTEDCPVTPAPSAPSGDFESSTPPLVRPPANPTPLISGLAAMFAKDSSRVSRRDGKPFTLTLRGAASLAPPANGYRLVIEGRFSAFSDGQAIRCAASSPDEAPVCIAAAEVDRVAFEDADGKLLKEWRQG